jgi:hypothetical protein
MGSRRESWRLPAGAGPGSFVPISSACGLWGFHFRSLTQASPKRSRGRHDRAESVSPSPHPEDLHPHLQRLGEDPGRSSSCRPGRTPGSGKARAADVGISHFLPSAASGPQRGIEVPPLLSGFSVRRSGVVLSLRQIPPPARAIFRPPGLALDPRHRCLTSILDQRFFAAKFPDVVLQPLRGTLASPARRSLSDLPSGNGSLDLSQLTGAPHHGSILRPHSHHRPHPSVFRCTRQEAGVTALPDSCPKSPSLGKMGDSPSPARAQRSLAFPQGRQELDRPGSHRASSQVRASALLFLLCSSLPWRFQRSPSEPPRDSGRLPAGAGPGSPFQSPRPAASGDSTYDP